MERESENGILYDPFGGLGLLCLLRPALVWKWTEQWKSYRADEPSELYRFGVRFGGALFLVFGVVLPLLPLLLK